MPQHIKQKHWKKLLSIFIYIFKSTVLYLDSPFYVVNKSLKTEDRLGKALTVQQTNKKLFVNNEHNEK